MQFLIPFIGGHFADIAAYAAASCHRSCATKGDRVFGREITDALHPVLEDHVTGHQFIVFVDLLFIELHEIFHALLEVGMNVVHHATGHHIVHGQPCAAGLFHDIIDGLPFTKGVEEGREGPEVHGHGAPPEFVRGDAGEFIHQHADNLRAGRNLHL